MSTKLVREKDWYRFSSSSDTKSLNTASLAICGHLCSGHVVYTQIGPSCTYGFVRVYARGEIKSVFWCKRLLFATLMKNIVGRVSEQEILLYVPRII